MSTRHLTLTILLTLLPLPLLSQGFFEYDYQVVPFEEGVNSEENDYAPVESIDGRDLYFTSYRDEKSLGDADVYRMTRSDREDPSAWARLLNPGSPFNSKGNDGCLTLFRDDRMIVFATEGRADGFGSTDLYIARFDHGRISNLRSLGAAINTEAWESQPAISPDERFLYFVSNREGGFGGGDIWVAEKIGEDADGFPQWGKPVNMGRTVNTAGEERAPTVALDGRTLYFASDGHDGFGGYDIWMTTRDAGIWGVPVNLGSTINSGADDLFFFAPRNDQPFYFASARDGGVGGLDLYYGTPNVFGRGLFRLTLSMIDGQGNALDGRGYVVDVASGDTVANLLMVAGRQEYTLHLPAGRSYDVAGVTADGMEQRKRVEGVEPDGTRRVDLRFGRVEMEMVDLGLWKIPFFVTGYYRPNTNANLEALFTLRHGELEPATYIEPIAMYSEEHRQYTAWGKDVEKMFDALRERMLDDICPRFAATAAADEVLEIRVVGFADPQSFAGRYYESTPVTFLDASGGERRIVKGTDIRNLELSGLRAWYSARHIDEVLSSGEGGELYRRLKQEGRVRYVAVAGDVARDAEGEPFEVQRRIGITATTTGAR